MEEKQYYTRYALLPEMERLELIHRLTEAKHYPSGTDRFADDSPDKWTTDGFTVTAIDGETQRQVDNGELMDSFGLVTLPQLYEITEFNLKETTEAEGVPEEI